MGRGRAGEDGGCGGGGQKEERVRVEDVGGGGGGKGGEGRYVPGGETEGEGRSAWAGLV